MLTKISSLLNDLKSSNINYCIFKEFNNPKELLNGNDGDIDILVDAKELKNVKIVFNKNDFFRTNIYNISDGIYYYIGLDEETSKLILLHVHTKLRIGSKVYKEYHYNFETQILKSKKMNVEYNFYYINEINELVLLLARLVLKKKIKQEDIQRLVYLSNCENIDKNEHNFIVEKIYKTDLNTLIKLINTDVKTLLNVQKNNVKKYLGKNIIKLILRKANGIILTFNKKVFKLFNCPNYKIRKFGKIYALQGIDGAGKTTQIALIKENQFLQATGIKTIYGGNNQYWFPFLKESLKKYGSKTTKKNLVIKKILSIWSVIDRRCRVLYAFTFLIRGYNVVFDRYFYDDLASIEILKLRNTRVKRLNKLLKCHLGYKPKTTFFLSLSPEEAYKRKQDYEFEKVQEAIKAYNNVFKGRKEVDTIDATQSIEKISSYIISKIYL